MLILHAFASGGAAMTGVEAISNGVPAFKPVEWKHARQTLVIMAILLGTMFLGISWLAAKMQIVPSDTKTVISQAAQAVYGSGSVGHALFLFTQAATMLILVLAANTSFADFPRLASFHANDAFMPKQLTKRGHRLVFSNGIIALAIAGAIPVIIFQADVTRLIPLYAIGVFTSFTLSQAGMAKKHIKDKEAGLAHGSVRERPRRLHHRRGDHRDRRVQVHGRGLVHHDPGPGHGVRPGPPEPRLRGREGASSSTTPARRPRPRSCATTR